MRELFGYCLGLERKRWAMRADAAFQKNIYELAPIEESV